MIDIHNHALPQVDDGARSLDEAVAIVEGLKLCGFTTLAPSPHHGGGSGGDVSKTVADTARNMLTEALRGKDIEIELLENSEHCVTPELFERLAEPHAIATIGGASHWLLLELPWEGIPRIAEQIFRIQTKGYRIVLAHPERYQFLEPNDARTLVDRGVKLQLEIGSFVGVYGDRARMRANSLLESGHTHVLASDVHRPEQCEWVARALEFLRETYGDSLVDQGCALNPQALVDDAPLDAVKELQP